jgi:hypothetical protein
MSNLSYIDATFPSYYDRSAMSRDAVQTRGRCRIAWKKYSRWWMPGLRHTHARYYCGDERNCQSFVITTVYEEDDKKLSFIQDIRNTHDLVAHPWIVAGNIKMVSFLIDRSSGLRGMGLMDSFNDLVRELGFIDVNLANMRNTWSSRQPCPMFSKLDMVFITDEWSLEFPVIILLPLPLLSARPRPSAATL